jgi:hypothetical protein
MDANSLAKELLAYSYVNSAMRIREAMRGELDVKCSRKHDAPPAHTGEVTGLCGQGGRHPYFRIPVHALDGALKRIALADERIQVGEIDYAVEEIAGACQELRQQTYFDDGTQCVNDRLPSMVPLLPPQEIWLDGHELPMDIWRLVCFEFDLVSSSVSAQVSVEDFAFSAVNQNALAFRLLLNQLGGRSVNFEFELNNVPTGWGSAVSSPLVVSLARIFFEAGSLLTPLADEPYIKGYAAIRYLHWIDGGSTGLKVRDEFDADTVDCRYRGLFAEETAIGLMAVVLNDVFGARPISNTAEMLPSGSIDRGQPVADFIVPATDPTSSQPTTIIAESKGSLGKVVSQARHARAKQQLASTEQVAFFGSTQLLPLTFASTIRFSRQRIHSRCVVTDPPTDLSPDATRVEPAEAWRVAYAKTLKFVGLETAGRQVARGVPATALRAVETERLGDRGSDRDRLRLLRARAASELFGMSLLLDVGRHALAIDTNVLRLLQREGVSRVEGRGRESASILSHFLDARKERARARFLGDSFETSLGLGCISYSALDGDGGLGSAQEV